MRAATTKPPVVSDTRAALVSAAADLIMRRGWASFSYKDLAKLIGISTASIHYHFPAKEDLGVAIVAHLRLGTVCQRNGDATKRVKALIEGMLKVANDSGCICPLGSLQAEFTVLPPRVQAAVQSWTDEQTAAVAALLAEARSSGNLKFSGTPQDQAIHLLCTVQGALQRSRVCGPAANPGLARALLASLGIP